MVKPNDEQQHLLDLFQQGHPTFRLTLIRGEIETTEPNGNGHAKSKKLKANLPVLFRTDQERKEIELQRQLPGGQQKNVRPPRPGVLKAMIMVNENQIFGIVDGQSRSGLPSRYFLPIECIVPQDE